MKQLFFSFLILAPAFASNNTSSDGKFHICFFELDNTKTSENFKGKQISGAKIHKFTPDGSNNTAIAFEDMIKATSKDLDKKRCDSLVISGHHTGNWYGKKGYLNLKELEALSCKPEYREWFSKIKALWLDGCNTVTDNIFTEDPPPKVLPSPDAEIARVAEKETKTARKVNQYTITTLNQAYSLSLDKNTPFSSRYLRMFSNTQIYGFNGVAPLGDDLNGRSFIATHLTNLGQAVGAENASENASDKIQRGLNAIMSSSDPCDEESIKAWKGVDNSLNPEAIEKQNYDNARKIGCDLILAKQVLDNPESKTAQEALAGKIRKDLNNLTGDDITKNQLLDLANAILNNGSSEQKTKAIELAKKVILTSLDEIAEKDSTYPNRSLTNLLFSNIYDTWNTAKKYQEKDPVFFDAVKDKLKKDKFTESLKTRIESDQGSSLRRADYIKFYVEVNDVEVNDDESGFIEDAITNLVDKSLKGFNGLTSPRQTNLSPRAKRALALSVVDQLLQYDLLNSKQISNLKDSTTLFPANDNDPFSLSVKVQFEISANGADTLLNNFDNKPSTTMALSRHFFRSEENIKTKSEKLTFLAEQIKTNENLANAFWMGLILYFDNKEPQERTPLLKEYNSLSLGHFNNENNDEAVKKPYLSDLLEYYENNRN